MKKIMYRTAEAKWGLQAGFGNHRIIISASKGEYVQVILPWRRLDIGVNEIGVKICYTPEGEMPAEGIGSKQVKNVSILRADQMEGEIVFSAPQEGEYEV